MFKKIDRDAATAELFHGYFSQLDSGSGSGVIMDVKI